ncbi:mannitol dehydrogenase [Knoellia sinensis KCTC 19936]|uniref:Mannitol-1-phosphate 5-dehydrogenase n=1 Tax=Knoellia sinensis KCTC 19936 TaxID=1385520 RepID=A0A0A0J0D3_9MICO|nr:mannitol dehydrogenase family protein [Knoellia sinensis]KGN30890.1 mannitol dehydrogenase [Knoellia sinensis KCTC 19936]
MSAETGNVPRLSRAEHGRAASPVRVVHLGLGNFFRAHAAWYTEHAPDAAEWGIAAFTGRSPDAAESLGAQDGLYTLLVRAADGPEPEVISSLSAVHPGADLAALRDYFARPEVAVVTITVTEAGYRRASDGSLDLDDEAVAADIAALRDDPAGDDVSTTPGRLVAGLLARRDADTGGIAIVPNDNVPDNGAMVARVVGDLIAEVDPSLQEWVDAYVSFVTTMVDRITPRTTDADRSEVKTLRGVDDPEVVPTEPFSEWVLAGEFPGGRPAWDDAGATVVDDVAPFEQRKLWLLNGSHSLMAYAASIRGHETVADAIADSQVREWVEEWWDAAAPHVPLPETDVTAYRKALIERYSNGNIRHLLAQIAADGSQKIPIRAVPVIKAELGAGRVSEGALRLVSAWIAHLRGSGAPVTDPQADLLQGLVTGSVDNGVDRVLEWLGLKDGQLRDVVVQQVTDLEAPGATKEEK